MSIKQRLKSALYEAAQPVLTRTTALKDSRKGQSCYIFGDGVSLKWFHLDALPPRPSFILSCLFFHREFSILSDVYGVLCEPYYFYPYFRLPPPYNRWWRNRIQLRYREAIADHPEFAFFVSLSNYPVLRGKNVFHHFLNLEDFAFARDCEAHGELMYGGSLKVAIAHAIYLGFSEIYLVGCDYTHENSRSHHWYEKGEGVFTSHPGYHSEFFEIAQRHVQITTITLDGGSALLPSKTYESFTGHAPDYRENVELATRDDLALLATWPDYTIF